VFTPLRRRKRFGARGKYSYYQPIARPMRNGAWAKALTDNIAGDFYADRMGRGVEQIWATSKKDEKIAVISVKLRRLGTTDGYFLFEYRFIKIFTRPA